MSSASPGKERFVSISECGDEPSVSAWLLNLSSLPHPQIHTIQQKENHSQKPSQQHEAAYLQPPHSARSSW